MDVSGLYQQKSHHYGDGIIHVEEMETYRSADIMPLDGFAMNEM